MDILVQLHHIPQILLEFQNAALILLYRFLLRPGVGLQLANSLRVILISALKLSGVMLRLRLLNLSLMRGLILLQPTQGLLELPVFSLQLLGSWVLVHRLISN
jgi:hypothetical protein